MIDNETASIILDELPADVQDYISNRGANYGITGEQIIRKTPSELHPDPWAMEEFWRNRDISHYEPVSKGGCRSCDDNWMAEDPSVNRSRGAEYMDPHERQQAYQDNAAFADGVKDQASKFGRTATTGLALGIGSMAAPAIVEGGAALAPLAIAALPWIALGAGVVALAAVACADEPETKDPAKEADAHARGMEAIRRNRERMADLKRKREEALAQQDFDQRLADA